MTRIKRWQRLLQDIDAQGALVLSESNRFYLSGFASSAGAVLITREKAYLIVDFRYYFAAASNSEGLTPVLSEHSSLASAGEIAVRHGIESLAYEEDFVTVSGLDDLRKAFPNAKLVRASKHITALRMQKDQTELSRIRAAQALTDKAFTHILGYIRPGISECEIALETEYFMRREGAQKSAFDTIAVSGPNTANPHGVPTDRRVRPGDFVTLDFGCVVEGYCSDMTRTVAVGHATRRMRDVYRTVAEAQQKALSGISAGKTGMEIDALARDHIGNAGYGDCFGHGLGHGVGIEVHEQPRFSPLYTLPVTEGAVMTVEPGIYLRDEFGVRIEDMVVVTKTGCDNLTRSPKELIVL